MQAIAEAAWLLQSNRWPFGIFGPRYFSDTSFEARGGGLSIVGVGVAQAAGVRALVDFPLLARFSPARDLLL